MVMRREEEVNEEGGKRNKSWSTATELA